MPRSTKPNATDTPGLSWVHELGEALLWPRLLRVPALAARPQRVVLGVFIVLVFGILGNIRFPWRDEQLPTLFDAMLGTKLDALGGVWYALANLDPALAARMLTAMLAEPTSLAMQTYPLESIVLGVPIALGYAVLAGALCRSVACEFSQEVTLPWTRQLAFSLERWRSMVGVLVLPWAVVGVIGLVLAIAGFVFFNGIPGPELLGGLLFGLASLLGLIAMLCAVAATLATPMLIPAVSCEGTDAIEAAGRALAYVFARPLRLLAYLAVAGAVCAVASSVALAIAEGASRFAAITTTAWVSPEGFAEVTGVSPEFEGLVSEDEAGSIDTLARTSSAMVGFWGSCLRVIAAGYVVSMLLTAGTLIYLFMRQVCDGQHYAELWTPGEIERSFAAALGRQPESPEPPINPDADTES